MSTLSGKTALVTGASRGIGRASAVALAAAGAQVLVHYGRGAKEADDVVCEIRKAGSRADAIAVDLVAADGPHKLAKQSRRKVECSRICHPERRPFGGLERAGGGNRWLVRTVEVTPLGLAGSSQVDALA